jgi:hypothetical protein
MSWRWSPELLDSHIAPGISSFTQASIPDIAGRFPQGEYWTSNHFLNNVLRGSFPERTRQFVLGFLRRAHLVHTAYLDARRLTLDYLEGNDLHNPSIAGYYNAIARWEQFAIEASITLEIWKWFSDDQGVFTGKDAMKKFCNWMSDDQGVLTGKDGPKEYRLYRIANKVKHVGDDIHKGAYTVDLTLPLTVSLWLSNAGLNSIETSVSYDEASKFVVDIAETADQLQDPVSTIERWRAEIAAEAEAEAAPQGQPPPASPNQ